MNTRSKQKDNELDQLERIIRETPVEVDLVNRTMRKYESSRDAKPPEKSRTRQKLHHRIMIITTSAAMVFSLLFILNLISPTPTTIKTTTSINDEPISSSVFKSSERDIGLHAADEKGLSTKLNTSVTHEGFTLSVTEVVYDGTRVAIGLERHQKEGENSKESLSEQMGKIEFSLNGKPLNYPDIISGVFMQPINDKDAEVIEITDRKNHGGQPFPKQFNLTLSTTIAGISEPFIIDIPVSDIGNYIDLQPNISRKYKNNHFTIEQVILTPVTTSITLRKALIDKSTSVDSRGGISIDVFDDQGNKLKIIHGNGSRETNEGISDLIEDLRLHPFETLPKAITIKPFTYLYTTYPNGEFQLDENGDPKIQYIPELEIIVPIASQQ